MAPPGPLVYPRRMRSSDPRDRRYTAEEYGRLPDYPDGRDELVRGRRVHEPFPRPMHGHLQARIGGLLDGFVRAHGLGYVAVETGFVLERGPDTVRGPDVAFVSRARYGDTLPEHWPEFGPDLAVEVRSPSDRPGRLAEKIAQYFAAGTRLVWVIDPRERAAMVYRGPKAARMLGAEGELEGEDVIPGFRCPIRELFD